MSQATLNYQVVAIVPHIPTINSSTLASSSESPGGMLVDYQTFENVYLAQVEQQQAATDPTAPRLTSLTVPVNHIWLSTRADAGSLASVRAALTSGTSTFVLSNLYDRRQIASELQNDPFNLNILIILSIGGLAAFLLAFIGNLISSWLSVRAGAAALSSCVLWERPRARSLACCSGNRARCTRAR